MTDPRHDLAEAAAAHAADIERLAELDEAQIAYLDRVIRLPDPATDGLECCQHEEPYE